MLTGNQHPKPLANEYIRQWHPAPEIITELYLSTLSRSPSQNELTAAEQLVKDYPSPQEGYEDLLWALVNSKAFLFVR